MNKQQIHKTCSVKKTIQSKFAKNAMSCNKICTSCNFSLYKYFGKQKNCEIAMRLYEALLKTLQLLCDKKKDTITKLP